MQKSQSLRRRWIRGGLLILFLIVLVAIVIYAVVTSAHYRNNLREQLEIKAHAVSELFSTFEPGTPEALARIAGGYAASFDDIDKLGMQFVTPDGTVAASNYPPSIGVRPETEDIAEALESGEIRAWSGMDPLTGNYVTAVSCPLYFQDGEAVGVMRCVSDMQQVRRQISYTVLSTAVFGLGILLLMFVFHMLFIRTITDPIEKLTDMAKRIADGSYGIQVSKKYDDEIGRLTDTINEMSTALANTEKLQSEFISSVSHELRTPLTAITGWSETLQYDESIQGDSRRGLQIISKEASRLTKMVVELLEFTRMQDGRFNLNVAPLDIASELEDIVFTYGSLLRQDGIELRMTPCEEDVPLIPGDAERLKQVFLNIIDNAAKYGRSGERVDVALTVKSGFVVATVRDYGGGIPENELPFVKQKFYKGSSKERGSGIGLAVCDEIIERHKGELIIENAPDKGVLVTVKLPILKA